MIKSESMSRRDFLTIAGVAMGTTAVAMGTGLVRQSPELGLFRPRVEKDRGLTESLIVPTQYARFIPTFERHDDRPSYVEEWESLGVSPVVHFQEMLTRESAAIFQKTMDPARYLFNEPFDAPTLVSFAKNSVGVAFEGIKLPMKKTFDLRDSLIGTIQTLVTGVVSNLEKETNADEASRLKEDMWNIQQDLSNSRPDDVVVRLRTLLMARKLQFLGKIYSHALGRHPDISFATGFAHQGILKLLPKEEKAMFMELDKTPESVLRSLVEVNGGIEALSGVLIVDANAVIVDNSPDAKRTIVDESLVTFLKNKLG